MSEVNLIVIGKTGVGKSSFCNYIFGEELFERGDGAPVTGWSDHFKYYDVGYESFNLRVFDTVGIETNNLSKWKIELDNFIESRSEKKVQLLMIGFMELFTSSMLLLLE